MLRLFSQNKAWGVVGSAQICFRETDGGGILLRRVMLFEYVHFDTVPTV